MIGRLLIAILTTNHQPLTTSITQYPIPSLDPSLSFRMTLSSYRLLFTVLRS